MLIKYICSFVIFCGAALLLPAQTLNEVRNGQVQFEDKTVPCVVVTLEPEVKVIRDEFEDWMQKEKDVDFDGKRPSHATEVKFGAISDKTMDLYFSVEKSGDQSELKMWGRFGYEVFIDPQQYPAEYGAMKSTVQEWVKAYVGEYYADQLKDAEKVLASAVKTRDRSQRDIDKLQEKNEKMEEKIEKMRAEIASNKEDIVAEQQNLSEANEEISTAEAQVSSARSNLQRIR